nr:hypothetical protein [uncultured Ruminococcus sp.]
MSYYATADGNIKLKNRLSEKRLEELIDILIEVFEDYDTEDDYQKVFFGGHIIEEGEVDYIGEDSALWRHIFIDGEWKEQSGKVVYT